MTEPKIRFLDLARQATAMRAPILAAIEQVVESGRFLDGERLRAFETEFAAACGVRECVGVASGTDAIELALRAAGIAPGDEVITSALSPVAPVVAIYAAGARPVLVDVEPTTLTLDPDAVESAIGDRTRAIVAVHLYGQCVDMDAMRRIAQARGLFVLEDAAQAHGAFYRGAPAGTIGDAAAFSFYPTKTLGAFGDAGAVITDDGELADRVRRLRAQGEATGQGSVERAGHSRLDELQAAVLSVKLPELLGWVDRRREIAARYSAAFASLGGVTSPEEDDRGRHAYHLYTLRIEERERFREVLASRGIETAIHYPRAIHQHRAYAELGLKRRRPIAEGAAASLVSLPLYPELSDREVESVTTAVVDAVRSL